MAVGASSPQEDPKDLIKGPATPEGRPQIRLTPAERRLLQLLAGCVSEGVALYFQDACLIIKGDLGLETRSHLAFHLLREIDSAIRSVCESIPGCLPAAAPSAAGNPDEPDRQLTHSEVIGAIVRCLGLPTEFATGWKKLRLHGRAHRDSLAHPRQLDLRLQDHFEQTCALFTQILSQLEARLPSWFAAIDELVRIPAPTGQHRKTLSNSIPRTRSCMGYFFGKLASPEWLRALHDDGHFRHLFLPTMPLERCPQTRYLVRVAASAAPDDVLTVITSIDSPNIWVREDLVMAATALPSDHAKEVARLIASWDLSPLDRTLLADALAAFIAGLAEDGASIDEAFALGQALLGCPVQMDDAT